MLIMIGTTEMLVDSESLAQSLRSAPLRGQLEAQLERLKVRLLRPLVESIANVELVKELSWAANEAAALAWVTVCPILMLPTLLEEKVREALMKWEKQEHLRQRHAAQ